MRISIIVTFTLLVSSCASLKYPNWEQVVIKQSVFKDPCQFKEDESCLEATGCVDDWYRKRATLYGANTVVMGSYTGTLDENKASASYFYCGPGLPSFKGQPNKAWIIKNIFNTDANQLDLDKSIAECNYESHKATIDTSRKNPTRLYIPTNDLFFNISQFGAVHKDKVNEKIHDLNLKVDKNNLFFECLQAKGFVSTRSLNTELLGYREKYCSDIDNLVVPCLLKSEK